MYRASVGVRLVAEMVCSRQVLTITAVGCGLLVAFLASVRRLFMSNVNRSVEGRPLLDISWLVALSTIRLVAKWVQLLFSGLD